MSALDEEEIKQILDEFQDISANISTLIPLQRGSLIVGLRPGKNSRELFVAEGTRRPMRHLPVYYFIDLLPLTLDGLSVITMYTHSGAKAARHEWTDSVTSVGMPSYVMVQEFRRSYGQAYTSVACDALLSSAVQVLASRKKTAVATIPEVPASLPLPGGIVELESEFEEDSGEEEDVCNEACSQYISCTTVCQIGFLLWYWTRPASCRASLEEFTRVSTVR